jgi:uncharacterized protein with GYD domain
MPAFVFLMRFTSRGKTSVLADPVAAGERWSQTWVALGGSSLDVHFTAGEYDCVAVGNTEHERVALGFAIHMADEGFVATQTMRAYSAADVREATMFLKPNVRPYGPA